MEKYETEMIKLNPDLLKTSCFGSRTPQNLKNKRRAEENRRRREIENKINQAEYARWLNSLPKKTSKNQNGKSKN